MNKNIAAMNINNCAEGINNLIFIVDDMIANRILLSDMLTHNGYTVCQATNGQSALAQIKIQKPSIVLLDIMMPIIDGFEVCRRLKADPCTSDIPVIFISALDDMNSRITGFQVGGVDYITKPFQKNEVLARIATHIQLYQLQYELKIKNQNLEQEILFKEKAEVALHQSEVKFKSIVDSSPIGMHFYQLLENQLLFKGGNPSADRMIGVNHQLLIDKTITEAFPKLEKTDVPEMYTRIAKGELGIQKFETEYHGQTINGTFEITAFQTDTNTICVSFVEISDRKQAEIALKESEARLHLSLKVTHASVFENNFETNEVIVTPELYNFLGYTHDEIPKTIDAVKQLIHTEDLPQVLKALDDHFTGNTTEYYTEFRMQTKTGDWRWVDGRGKITKWDKNGKPIVLLGLSRDIHEYKLAAELLSESENRYNTFINTSMDLFFVKDDQFRYIMANDAMAQLFGKNKEDLLNKTDQQLDPNNQYLPCNSSDKRALESTDPFTIEEQFGDRIYETTKFPISLNNNKKGIGGIMRDITDRKRDEERITNQNNRLNAIIEALPDFIFISDQQGNYIEFLNPTGKKLLFPSEKLIGANVKNVFDKATADLHIQKINECINSRKLITYEYSGDKNGETSFFEARIVYLDNNSVLRFVRDITLRKIAQLAIQEEKQLLRTLIDNLPVSIYVKDKEGRKIISNRTDVANIGYKSEADVLGKTDKDLFAGEAGVRGYNDDMRIIHSGEAIINQEEVFPGRNGESRWTLTSKLPLYDRNKNITGLVGIGLDITEQKKANETIHKLSLSIEQNPSSIVITDINGNIEYVNPRFTEVTGYTSEEVIGKNPNILKSGETSPAEYKKMWDTLTTDQIWRGEFHNRKKNGELFWEWAIMTSIKNEKGAVTNYIAIKEDISIRKQMEVDLILAKEKAEENDRLKSSFLANMSHEIRTPLNSILGFADLLSDPEIEEDADQRIMFANLIISSGTNLLNIINDIMDLSKIESGQIQINYCQFSILKMLHDVWNEYNLRAAEKGIKLILNENNLAQDIYINSDESKLKQVLINFIGNAIKFTAQGTIELNLENTENDSFKLSVTDSGIGIQPENAQYIFERFRQIEGSATRKYGGNGLGLAISKSLIEILGGTIGVESIVGKGSTFYFIIPRERKLESK